ncbi:hypothetical protein TNCV_2092171 [Trichonephila clavipes]|nr:hypothetical protein TNCV_2092171 [Trichonephila clavipes]
MDAQVPQAIQARLYNLDNDLHDDGWGCGSPVVKVSNHGRHVMSSIPVPLKTRRIWPIHVKSVRTQCLSACVVMRGAVLVTWCGRRSLEVKVTNSWLACHEFEPSTTEDLPCRGPMHFTHVVALTSSQWCAVEVMKRAPYRLFLIQQFQTLGVITRRNGHGRPGGVTSAKNNYLVLNAHRQRDMTVWQLSRELVAVSGIMVPRQTV